MAVSLPLVAWDTGYVLLRPLSMPGGALHWPVWAPYDLYGRVDHMYGFKQWYARNGFTAAQGVLNLAETAMYLAYLYIWWAYSTFDAAKSAGVAGRKGVGGRAGALAVLLAYAAASMTLSKTVLYCEPSAPTPYETKARGQPQRSPAPLLARPADLYRAERGLLRLRQHRPQRPHVPHLPMDHPKVSVSRGRARADTDLADRLPTAAPGSSSPP